MIPGIDFPSYFDADNYVARHVTGHNLKGDHDNGNQTANRTKCVVRYKPNHYAGGIPQFPNSVRLL
jgi:hypothetical protein